jgi:hypothetical protein
MPISTGLQILRGAEAARSRGDDIVDGWNEEGALHWEGLQRELAWARRGVAIYEHQCQRFERYAPQQAQQAPQAQAPQQAPRIAAAKKEAPGG